MVTVPKNAPSISLSALSSPVDVTAPVSTLYRLMPVPMAVLTAYAINSPLVTVKLPETVTFVLTAPRKLSICLAAVSTIISEYSNSPLLRV